MSDADRSQYSDEVTELSESELQQLLEIAAPPVSLLGGWAVHLHVTDPFEAEHGREYIGSRDIDLGVHVDPEWDAGTSSRSQFRGLSPLSNPSYRTIEDGSDSTSISTE